MMFENINNMSELESAYEYEKKQIDKKLENLHELKHRLKIENERSYDAFLYMKNKMDYSEVANNKMLNLVEEFDEEVNSHIRRTERQIIDSQEELKSAFLRQSEII